MDTISQAASRTARLNPFAFPSDTTFRFVLLVVSVVGTSLFAYNWLFYIFFEEEFNRVYEQCQEEVATAYLLGASSTTDPMAYIDQQAARIQALNACFQPIEYIQFAFIAGGVVLFLIVATGLYWTAPARKIRREELAPLSDEDSPEMVAYLTDLCQEARLARPPTFLLNTRNHSSSGLAFGRLGQYYVVLNAGLVIQFAADRSAFRAIVLHELAHLRNADVNKTYFALATWQAFIVTALLPFSVSLIYYLLHYGDLGLVFSIAWRVLALTALVYLTRSAILRAREVYADVQASVWDGPSGALKRVLATQPSKEDRWRDVLKEGRWRDVLAEGHRWAMLRAHPNPDERRRALAEPHRLLRMGFWDAFGTGVAATIAFANISFVLHLVIAPEQAWLVPITTALVFAPLVVGVVGLGAWRGTFAALARGEAPRGIGRLGLSLGLGILLGTAVSLDSSVSVPEEVQGNAGFFFYVLWGALVLISIYFFVRWIAAGASVWLEVAITRRSLRLIYVLGLAIAAGLLTWWLGTLFLYYSTVTGGDSDYMSGNPLVMIANLVFFGPDALIAGLTFTFLMLISLWAFPLAARFWSKRATVSSESRWAFLDPSPPPLTLPSRPPLRPAPALIIGSIGGLLFCGLMVLIRATLHFALSDAGKNTPETQLMFFGVQIALALLLQLIVAAVGAIWVKRLGWAHGLCAAFVAGCIMTIGALGLTELTDCVPILGITGWQESCSIIETDPGFAMHTLRYMVIWGTLLSLPVAVGVSAIRENSPLTKGDRKSRIRATFKVFATATATIVTLIIITLSFGMDILSLGGT